jgi:hypothetical protein
MSDDLIARCWEVIRASDQIALRWPRVEDDGIHALEWSVAEKGGTDLYGFGMGVTVAGMGRYGFTEDEAAFLVDNDPSSRLALNRALNVMLDGIEATLTMHRGEEAPNTWPKRKNCTRDGGLWPCPDHRRASDSLAAIAQALGVKEDA